LNINGVPFAGKTRDAREDAKKILSNLEEEKRNPNSARGTTTVKGKEKCHPYSKKNSGV